MRSISYCRPHINRIAKCLCSGHFYILLVPDSAFAFNGCMLIVRQKAIGVGIVCQAETVSYRRGSLSLTFSSSLSTKSKGRHIKGTSTTTKVFQNFSKCRTEALGVVSPCFILEAQEHPGNVSCLLGYMSFQFRSWTKKSRTPVILVSSSCCGTPDSGQQRRMFVSKFSSTCASPLKVSTHWRCRLCLVSPMRQNCGFAKFRA